MYVAEEVSEGKDVGRNLSSCHYNYKQPPPDGVASDVGSRLGTKPQSVDAQKGTMLDIFVRCLKKNIAQVCT
jgi:hypothetical protein